MRSAEVGVRSGDRLDTGREARGKEGGGRGACLLLHRLQLAAHLVELLRERGCLVVGGLQERSQLDAIRRGDPDGARSAVRALLIKSESDALTGLRAKVVAQ